MYPFHQGDSSAAFQFLTDSGITYIVEFSDASGYFDNDCVLCQSIEAVAFFFFLSKGKFDAQIRETICDIIRQRCVNNGVAIVFICDQSGGHSRHKVFTAWDAEFNGGQFHFQPAEIVHPGGILYTGMIVQTKNPNSGHYLGEFRNNMNLIQAKLN